MPSSKPFHIAIIGGGISGVTLAIALRERNIPVTVYEQASSFAEIGAGVTFGPNALQAMSICAPGIKEAFLSVRTNNGWPSKKQVWFDVFDGFDENVETNSKALFELVVDGEHGGVHRANFLDEVVKLIPYDIVNFRKRLNDLVETEDGKVVMKFEDGTTAEADAVVGCDGVKSIVRQIMLGTDNPASQPSYTHKYCYRGLIPMDQAVALLGEEKARNSCIHMGYGGHLLTFPVKDGEFLNVVAFRSNCEPWTQYPAMTKRVKREDAQRDFQNFNTHVRTMMEMLNPDLECWALFDLGGHPLPVFNKGRICVLGDAAHASTPHQGAAAGVAIEDCAVLSNLLANERVKTHGDLTTVFSIYNATRKARGEWLIKGSRRNGELVEWQAEGVLRDIEGIKNEIRARSQVLWYVDVEEKVREAKGELEKAFGTES